MQGVPGTEDRGWSGAGLHQYEGEEPGGFFRGIPGFHEVYHGDDGRGGGAYGQRADQADTPRGPEGEGIGEDGGEVHAGLGREGIGT